MAWKQYSASEMDEAGEKARTELKTFDPVAVQLIARWWKKYYIEAGHKRLGRHLLSVASIASLDESSE